MRRSAILVSAALHLILLAVLVMTDAVRLPDLASLLEDPEGAAARESVVYLPIDGFPGPRTSAQPSSEPAAVSAAPAAPLAAPAPATGLPAATPDVSPIVPGVSGVPGADSGGVPGGSAGGTAESARDRFNRAVEALRPRLPSPLLRDANIDRLRTDEERAQLRAYARIRALNDSILAEVEAGRRATDWTWTDDQGRRWGISPGKLHLGGIEIPLPVQTAGSREDRDMVREWQEIQAQAERGAIDETFDERVEAIRARRDAERDDE